MNTKRKGASKAEIAAAVTDAAIDALCEKYGYSKGFIYHLKKARLERVERLNRVPEYEPEPSEYAEYAEYKDFFMFDDYTDFDDYNYKDFLI